MKHIFALIFLFVVVGFSYAQDLSTLKDLHNFSISLGSSKIVTADNQILNVVNNYEYMSYNFGPTLLSWMEEFAPQAYERVIKADIQSVNHAIDGFLGPSSNSVYD